MCHIRTHKEIKDSGDINSLITGVIFRQKKPFCRVQILDQINSLRTGSQYAVNNAYIESMVDDRLNYFERNNYLEYNDDLYYPRNVIELL